MNFFNTLYLLLIAGLSWLQHSAEILLCSVHFTIQSKLNECEPLSSTVSLFSLHRYRFANTNTTFEAVAVYFSSFFIVRCIRWCCKWNKKNGFLVTSCYHYMNCNICICWQQRRFSHLLVGSAATIYWNFLLSVNNEKKNVFDFISMFFY